MDTYPDFVNYLKGCQASNTQAIQESEQALRQCKQADPTKYIFSLIKELCDEANSADAGAIAAVLFKNALINSTNEEGSDGLWFSIPEEMRGHIKDALLQLLPSHNSNTLKNASICLAIIGALEVPDGLWDQFLTMMQENSTNEDNHFRLASVQTLGLLCEFLDQYIDKQLRPEQIGQVLHATICNIDAQQIELSRIAIKALQRIIPYTEQNFQNKEQRDFIMEGLFRAISIDDEAIQTDALQAISEVPNIAYMSISEYIPKIGELTFNFLNMGQNALLQARYMMHFWTQLCTIEQTHHNKETSLNIIMQYKDSLLPIIYQGLQITEFDNEDDQIEESTDDVQWTVSRASGTLLIEVTALLRDQVLSQTILFASTKLNQENQTWQDNYVSMIALGSVMDGPNSDLIHREMEPAYQTILSMLASNSSSRVRFACAWLISQIVKFSPQLVFSKQENLQNLIDVGMQNMSKDHMQVRQFIATAWHTAFEQASKMPQQYRAMLNPNFLNCMNTMLFCLFEPTTLSSGTLLSFSNSVNTTLEVCDNEFLRNDLFQVCEVIYQKIVEFNQGQNPHFNPEQREHFLNNWCSTLQPCLVRLGNEGLTEQMLPLLIDLAVNIFMQFGKVMNGGLFILNGIIATVEARITPFLPKFIQYLICAMKMENCDAMGTRVACGLISDLSNSIGEEILEWMPQIMGAMQQILINNTFDSEAKLIAIIAFGDICLAAGAHHFLSYLPETQNSFTSASQMSLNKGTSPDEMDLLERLRIALIDAYISILHGLYPDDNSQPLTAEQEDQTEQFALQMFQFLEAMVANKTLPFPNELLKPLYELFLDLSTMYITKLDNSRTPSPTALGYIIMQSNLTGELRQGIVALHGEDRADIEARFYDTENQISNLRARMASPPPGQYNNQLQMNY